MMNALSPFTYYRRHKRQVLLLTGLVTLATLGLYVMVGVLGSFLENAYLTNNSLTRFSLVRFLGPADVSQIRTHPDVAHVVPVQEVNISVPMIALDESFRLLGIPEDAWQALLDVCDVRLKEGRPPRPRTNELVLSEEIARALGLRVGDRIGRSINERYYKFVPTEFVLVGILENAAPGSGPGVRVGFVSYEYLENHELYRQPTALLVVAKEGRKAAVDDFLESMISPYTDVQTYGRLSRFYGHARLILYLVFGIVDLLVAAATAGVIGTINRIALAQRLEEFGVLHALGHAKKHLIHRVTLEVAIVVGIAWLIGLALTRLVLAWLGTHLYEPRGLELNLGNSTPLWFTLPIPLVVVGFVAFSTARVFARLDPVAVIERGKLSMESGEYPSRVKLSTRPLSSRTFYLRHPRRGVALVATMALMILSVALPVFFFLSIQNAQKPLIEHLRVVSVVSAKEGEIDPGIVAQIRTHPAVAAVVPVRPLLLAISVPPLLHGGVPVYGVPEENMPPLLDLYGLEIKEGRLPRSRAAEMVVSETVARNRGLHVGDRVGRPVYEQDGFTFEMTVVGILRPRSGSNPSGPWFGLASYEYQSGDQLLLVGISDLLVVPAEGRKAELDTWLEEDVASTDTEVETYDSRLREMQQASRNMLLLFALVEGIIAVVAAAALAVLHYISLSQRWEEFGVLHAIGYSRTWLLWRVARETVSIIALAWLIGAAICTAGLVITQIGLYSPRGLHLDLFDAAPWLFTLPIPLTVLIVSVVTIARPLVRVDSVSIIERRR